MIHGSITQPQMLQALAGAGHTSKVLIVDGYFPSTTMLGPDVPRVYLNLCPGQVDVPTVLRAIVGAIPIESAVAATFEDGSKPEVWADYATILPSDLPLTAVKGSELADQFTDREVALAVMTGDTRVAACVVLTVGLTPVDLT